MGLRVSGIKGNIPYSIQGNGRWQLPRSRPASAALLAVALGPAPSKVQYSEFGSLGFRAVGV